ncbi:rRNA maturation RNase YbeY [Nitratifractor sp.]
MMNLINTTSIPMDEALLQKIVEAMSEREVEVILCEDAAICRLNREHRGIDRPTDVLSFPLDQSFEQTPLGSIVLSVDRAREVAEREGHSMNEELALLLIHGMLHLLGYDHETDDGTMREREAEWIRRFDLPESLIVRTEG